MPTTDDADRAEEQADEPNIIMQIVLVVTGLTVAGWLVWVLL